MPPEALEEIFAAEATLVDLAGGAPLATAGEPVRSLYRVRAGRLAEFEPTTGGGQRAVTTHRPGDLIGGAQLLGDGRFRTGVIALRDSELQAIKASRAQALFRERPEFLAEVARASLTQLRIEPANRRRTSILGLVSLSASFAMRRLAERLASAMRALGAEVAVLGSEATDAEPSYLEALEIEHDFILMAAEQRDEAFAAYCSRQIDRLVLFADASAPVSGVSALATEAIRKERLIDVVLLHPMAGPEPCDSERWLDAGPVARLFHIGADDTTDLTRLARIYTGNSIGLALGGGGARAYAHLGVARALRELGVPIDFLAGTSMGAVIAACLAKGWNDDEIDRRIREAFVRSSPLSDIAFPILALTRGRIVDRRLLANFGEAQIGDLWRPFVCVSTDLTQGGMRVHRRGSLRRALRASLSIPGVLPPAVVDGHVLVDGALVCNLPSDLVRAQHDGVTVAVDVAVAEEFEPDDLVLKPSGWRWLTSGAWLRGPPIVAVLIRSATAGLATGAAPPEDLITIAPNPEGVGLQDWKAYDRSIEAGYREAMAAAEQLSALRR